MSDMIASLLVSGGTLILSGILHEQADSVISAYQSHIALAPLVQQEDWIRLSGTKR
jgi:ribosomal protein L11 methyltransferase